MELRLRVSVGQPLYCRVSDVPGVFLSIPQGILLCDILLLFGQNTEGGLPLQRLLGILELKVLR